MNVHERTQSLHSSFRAAEMVYAALTHENGLSKRYCGSKT